MGARRRSIHKMPRENIGKIIDGISRTILSQIVIEGKVPERYNMIQAAVLKFQSVLNLISMKYHT